jgi:hypothetical protein
MIVADQLRMSSPSGPALQFAGGSFAKQATVKDLTQLTLFDSPRSSLSFIIRFIADMVHKKHLNQLKILTFS